MSQFARNLNASEERWASERLHTLYVINDMLKQVEADGLRMSVILPRVLELAVKQLDAHDGSIIVVNSDFEVEHAWLTDGRFDPQIEEIMIGGVAGWVIRHQEPTIIYDTSADDRWLPHPGNPSANEPWSVICTPFMARDRAIGAITIHKPGTGQFDEQDLSLLVAISSQAASTIENARLFEESQRQLQVSALLNQASRAINFSLDINRIMQSLLAQMNELLNAEALSIALVDKQTNELVYQVAEGIGSDKIVNLRLPSNIGISGWVMEHGTPVLVQDTSRDSRFHQLGDELTGHRTKAMLCAPIQFQGVVLGTIQAINPIQGAFTSDDLDLLVNLANIASSAIANAQQFALIQAAEERYMSLFQSSIDPIVLTDSKGNIVEANRRSLEALGRSRDSLLKLNIRDLHPADVELPDPAEILADRPRVFASRLLSPENQVTHVEVHVKRALSHDSQLLQWIHHDVSKQIELEAMREELTAMLFHDLQSPLGNVIASLEMLITEVSPDMDPVFPNMLDIAMRSSLQLQSLIKSLLDINRLEAGHPISGMSEVDLNSLIDDVQEIARPRLDRQEIGLFRELEPELPHLYVEEDMILRVLSNLVDNALRYAQETDHITISAIRDNGGDNMILISVTDRGVGIPRKDRQRIFGKFERVQTDSVSGGLGLGLAFCRLAVEAHGGRIWADGAPGGGARFNFTLPAATGNAAR